MKFVSPTRSPMFVAALAATLASTALTGPALASSPTEAALLIEADTGKVLYAENAGVPWYPASLSKLMTMYVVLQAVKNKRITLDSLYTVSARAASQAPSKIGFKPGSQITVDNALKILMVKSANDMAVLLAEGTSGSVEAFAAEMIQTSKNLGMTQSHWVNPNGLPADEQITSARDLGILARAAGGVGVPIYASSLRDAPDGLLEHLGTLDALVTTVLAAGGTKPATASAGEDDEAWDVERLAALDILVIVRLGPPERWGTGDRVALAGICACCLVAIGLVPLLGSGVAGLLPYVVK